ncbi:MAG: FAD-dependent oxidoreductase [Clostridia bacterium]|nr:FAD-dependent oxidoreductase [Clostridia bacterium]
MSSYWIDSTKDFNIGSKIDDNYTADVCIIGAGICGLSTAYYLSKKGLKVIVIDKDDIGEKASGNTTAKITMQHGLIYDYLLTSFNENFARDYFNANKKAISNIKEIIDLENINCDFEYKQNLIFTTTEEDVEKIQNEVDAINLLSGKQDYTELLNSSDLPFNILAGVMTKNQAQFHPRKYMYGLANVIENNEGLIFTNSVVTDIKKDGEVYNCYSDEYTIKSKYVVLASHYPFINFPGLYFSKMYQVTSYAIAIETKKDLPSGMYISSNEPTISYRTAKFGDKELLILSGGNHKTGYSPDSDENYGYKFLEQEAKKYFPDYEIKYKWNTRDCISLDKIPYIGDFSNFMPNMYVATGFNKWGMTSSNVAANIIADSILGINNKYADVFNSTRLEPLKNKEEFKNMVNQVVKSFVTNRIKIPKEDISVIKNDNGGIIKIDGDSIGVYKDENGKIYAVNPTCTHLGCLLTWNNLDKTWDCPCHGSRFDYTGKNLYDPAFKDLQIIDIED